ncbi:hypothetical protein [Marinimicrobium sp. ABcell2]|uniref:hypothetical protein n=1 Tax=Marinimicrobium sp. ABcell2 TaxID=3069751 RepID=UPI0027B01C1D|nr:hypothetical protein [Marinimicrobium sp. ABcell2]MDQ2075285.1 hypothetical protein [Marinimicrobium sp. ABcell2]
MEFILNFSPLTLVLLALIGMMTLYFIGPGYSHQSAAHSPTILTSTGIFGTFLGVALGLLEFDTDNIQASVPALIVGLQTAFWTSIAGLLGALAVKFRHLLTTMRQVRVGAQYESATIDDLANLLGDIRASLGDPSAGGLRTALDDLQTQQHREGEQLRASLERYQADMTEANTRALISALETVMRDFNTQINTQYGENFKELNEAVGNMLIWQQNYKTELQELLVTQQSNGELLDRAAQAYEKVVTHSEIFNRVSESMGSMMEALQTQSEGLDRYLSQLATVADKAAEGLPSLEGRVDALTHQLAESVTRNQEQLSQVLNEASAALRDTSAQVSKNLADSLDSTQKGLQEQVSAMVTRTGTQVEELDKALEAELTKALTTFGYQLTSLSEKFVNDYAPLTDKLRDLVQLAAAAAPAATDGTHEQKARAKKSVRS